MLDAGEKILLETLANLCRNAVRSSIIGHGTGQSTEAYGSGAEREAPMRNVVTLFVAISCITSQAAASQTRSGGPAAGQPAVRACAVLTRDLVAPFTENRKILDLIPPEEEALGTSGTACDYGAVRLQLFPGRGGKRTFAAKDLQPISGVGEGGYFRSNGDLYAELMVWTGKHSLDLQVSVPSGRTAEAIKPDVVALANAIIAKLP